MPRSLTLDPAVAEVFITDELRERAPKKVDYYREKLALQDLAGRMAQHPEEVLPRFVDLAMEMTEGSSAGLSLYEPNPAPGVFRWRHLRGKLAPFENATTPRNFSPCGVTLDENRPVLSSHPERVYNWISEPGIVVPEVLLVPLYIGGDTPLGTLWIVSEVEGHFDMGHSRAVSDLASFVDVALTMMRSKEQLQAALDEQQMLAREMDHRIKNIFAMTKGLIRITAKGATTKEDLTEDLLGRLGALARAHALVRRSFAETGSIPQTPDLETLVVEVLKPHEQASNGSSRFAIDGPEVRCGSHATNGIALILHELATNAAKYGALRNDDGTVAVSWRKDGDRLHLKWVERGGPKISAAPLERGFGSALAEAMVSKQLSGSLNYDWQPDGVIVTMSIPTEKLAA